MSKCQDDVGNSVVIYLSIVQRNNVNSMGINKCPLQSLSFKCCSLRLKSTQNQTSAKHYLNISTFSGNYRFQSK